MELLITKSELPVFNCLKYTALMEHIDDRHISREISWIQWPGPIAEADLKISYFRTIFFFNIGCFDPLCVRSPLDTLESGVLFHIWWLSKQLIVLHDSPPWKVALCLPYPTTPSPPRHASTGWNDQLWNTLHHVSHIVDCSPSALLPSGELDTDGMRRSPWTNLFEGCRPA